MAYSSSQGSRLGGDAHDAFNNALKLSRANEIKLIRPPSTELFTN